MASPPPLRTWRELILWLAAEYHDGKLYPMARHLQRAPALLYQWRDGVTKQPGPALGRVDRDHVRPRARRGHDAGPGAARLAFNIHRQGENTVDGWTANEDKYQAIYRGRRPIDRPGEPGRPPVPEIPDEGADDDDAGAGARGQLRRLRAGLFRYHVGVTGTAGGRGTQPARPRRGGRRLRHAEPRGGNPRGSDQRREDSGCRPVSRRREGNARRCLQRCA